MAYIKILYIFVLKIIYKIFKIFNTNQLTVLVYDFELTNKVYQNQYHGDLIFLDNKKTNIIKKLYILSSAQKIIFDNYDLHILILNSGVDTYLIWHASSAVKKFGLNSNTKYSNADIKRYKQVYNRYNYILVSSSYMKDIFVKSFGVEKSKFLNYGYHGLLDINDKIIKENMILYVPTFRDSNHQDQIDFIENYSNSKYKLYYSLHPSVGFVSNNPNAIKINNQDINIYIKNASLIISDYSSLLMEAIYLNGHVVAYCYDYDTYLENPGISLDLNSIIKVIKNKYELIEYINNDKYNNYNTQEFSNKYYTYANKNAPQELSKLISKN